MLYTDMYSIIHSIESYPIKKILLVINLLKFQQKYTLNLIFTLKIQNIFN